MIWTALDVLVLVLGIYVAVAVWFWPRTGFTPLLSVFGGIMVADVLTDWFAAGRIAQAVVLVAKLGLVVAMLRYMSEQSKRRTNGRPGTES